MENPNFKTCSSRKNRKEFLDKPVLQNSETLQKNPHFEIFLGPLKIAGNRGKIQSSKPVHCRKTVKNPNFETCSLSLPKKPQLANPHIFLSFLLTSASK
jgi:hypothetical protein